MIMSVLHFIIALLDAILRLILGVFVFGVCAGMVMLGIKEKSERKEHSPTPTKSKEEPSPTPTQSKEETSPTPKQSKEETSPTSAQSKATDPNLSDATKQPTNLKDESPIAPPEQASKYDNIDEVYIGSDGKPLRIDQLPDCPTP